MEIHSASGKGDFVITKEGSELLKVRYDNWFSSRAKTNYNGRNIVIKPKNIWCSKFDVFIDDNDVGDLLFNWKGEIIIRVLRKKSEKSYLLRSKGFWKQTFELMDESNNLVLRLGPKMKSNGNFDYVVDRKASYIKEEEWVELLIFCGFAANLYLSTSQAALSGSVGI